jgi:glutaminyl-tRNA synthetase
MRRQKKPSNLIEREGYFCVDNKDSTPEHLVFNRTAALRDSWGG